MEHVRLIHSLSGLFTYPGVWDKLCIDYSGLTAQHSILIPFYVNSYAECLRAANQLKYKRCIESSILHTARYKILIKTN